jgi:hypothetical protein
MSEDGLEERLMFRGRFARCVKYTFVWRDMYSARHDIVPYKCHLKTHLGPFATLPEIDWSAACRSMQNITSRLLVPEHRNLQKSMADHANVQRRRNYKSPNSITADIHQ